jgi:hypothetical protein
MYIHIYIYIYITYVSSGKSLGKIIILLDDDKAGSEAVYRLCQKIMPIGMYTYVYVCICMYICIYVYVCIYVYMYINVYVFKYVYFYGSEAVSMLCQKIIPIGMYTYVYVCICMYICIYVYKCVCI